MKRYIALSTLVIAFAATLVVSTAARAQTQGPACSLALTAGKYGFSDSGTVVGVGPRAAVGIFTLDAAGNVLNGKATASLNGSVATETFSGTYTVSPDCTGTATVDILDQSGIKLLTLTEDLVFDDNVRELRAIFTSVVLANGTPLHTVITLNARKLFSGPGNQNEQ